MKVRYDKETGRDKVHDGKVLDNNILVIQRATDVVVVLVLQSVIGTENANMGLLD